MVNIDEWSITDAVLKAQAQCPSPRLYEILGSLVTHLHSFAREVRLTEGEWLEGIRFLTDAGHITDEKRQEFILLSDALGLSTLVTAQNNSKPPGYTESTVFGPFFVEGAPAIRNGEDISGGAAGEPCFVSGTVFGAESRPVPGAHISVWQSDQDGLYDVQRPELEGSRARAVLTTLEDGRFYFKTILAAPYPIPADGPVGRMLSALGRHPWRPAHLHFMITAPGYERLITHLFRADSPYLESDAVFGVRSSLVTEWERHDSGPTPDGHLIDSPFYTLRYDFKLYSLLQRCQESP